MKIGREDLDEMIDSLMDKEKKRFKDKDYFKIRQYVFDSRTVRNLLKLFNKGALRDFTWIVSMGKEAVVLSGTGDRGPVAIKIYKSVSSFRRQLDYILGDFRFEFRSKSKLLDLWVEKEFRNLQRFKKAGVRVPEPYARSGNILVMEFIGDGGFPAPRLKDVMDLEIDPEIILRDILDNVARGYRSAELVHSDLSEYNVLLWNSKPWIIDVSQAVTTTHPRALEYLKRDVTTIIRFFRKRWGIGLDPDLVFNRILEGDCVERADCEDTQG